MPEALPQELPFQDKKIYFAAPIKGGGIEDTSLVPLLIDFMRDNGGTVLTEHIGYGKTNEQGTIRLPDIATLNPEEPWFAVRENDMAMVLEAHYFIFIGDKSSTGVGMELQKTMDKEKLGYNRTPILCLINVNKMDDLSFMVRGISRRECPEFQLFTYENIEDAKKIITEFLVNN